MVKSFNYYIFGSNFGSRIGVRLYASFVINYFEISKNLANHGTMRLTCRYTVVAVVSRCVVPCLPQLLHLVPSQHRFLGLLDPVLSILCFRHGLPLVMCGC